MGLRGRWVGRVSVLSGQGGEVLLLGVVGEGGRLYIIRTRTA